MFTGEYQRSEACAMKVIKNGGDAESAMIFVQGEDGKANLYTLTRTQVESLYEVACKVLGK